MIVTSAPGGIEDPYTIPNISQFGLASLTADSFYGVGARTEVSTRLVDGQNTVLLICFGQSLLANHNQDSYVAGSNLNQQFCIRNGGIYVAANPHLGTSWIPGRTYSSSYVPRLAGKLITDGYCARVITANVAVGATDMNYWTPSGAFARLLTVLCRRLWAAGLTCSTVTKVHILVHQGENQDCRTRGLTSTQYRDEIRAAIGVITAYTAPDGSTPFAAAKAFVQVATMAGGTTHAATAAGQAAAPNGTSIFQGYDLDTYVSVGNRFDSTHLSEAGCILAANGTAAILESH